ncbi:MAG TPA: M6 family metalloprotease domain-containing protein [Candidatus Izemoplasmatales bacterium]|nr:M6 family metalloprotease domain-containing protein [Candidatus Izemoplasmatales bacterium]
MKKIRFLFLTILPLFLIGCAWLTATENSTTATTASTTSTPEDETTSTTTETTTTTTTSPSTTTTTTATTTTTTTATTTTTTTTSTVTTTTTSTANEAFVLEDYETIGDAYEQADEVISIPSKGNVKGLVLAIDFSDYPSNGDLVSLADLQTVFNGTSESIPYESVKSYFAISSMNALNLSFDIYGFYRADYSSAHYAADYEEGNPASDLVVEVLDYYNSIIDYTQYDANDDGYLDALYIIYTAPVSFDYGSDLWWAYMDVCVYYDQFDGMEPYYYVFSGTDFFDDGSGDLDARTIIHETGHLLGLEDYYDYDDSDQNNSGGLGGFDMMDNTLGDMNPFSKLLLGWITPTVVTGNGTFRLPKYVEAGEVLLVIPEWRGTIFDEYLLICNYSPEGLYEADKWDLFWTEGVIIYHVDARIGNGFDENSAYWTIFNYNNTDAVHKLIKIIEADEDGDIDRYSLAENSDLFQTGDVLGDTVYPNYVWYQSAWNPMAFTVGVGAKDSSGVWITITRKSE